MTLQILKIELLIIVITLIVTICHTQTIRQHTVQNIPYVQQTRRYVNYPVQLNNRLIVPVQQQQHQQRSQPPQRQYARPKNNGQRIDLNECNADAHCQFFYNCTQKASKLPKFCSMNNGFTGVCCLDNVYNSYRAIQAPVLSNTVTDKAKESIKNLVTLEDELHRYDLEPKTGTQEFSHQNFFGYTQMSLKEMNDATQVLEMFINFAKSKNMTSEEINESNINIQDISSIAGLCEPKTVCTNINYRNPDGTCNNLINTNQGKAISTFVRLLAPNYGDSINEPRRASDGSELPNPRQISLSISPESQLENDFYSVMLMQFGQFIDHDLSRTAITRTHDNKQISCCDEKVRKNPRLLHPACFAIPVPDDDFFLLSELQSCINFVRSAPAFNPKCRFGPREQLNQLTSYIDGDNIYGPSLEQESRLRQFKGGLMKTSILNQKPFPPLLTNRSEVNCQVPRASNMSCFLAGDIRTNEVVDLVVLNTVFIREHNRIAGILQRSHPNWNDETLFQETKRIIIAEMQHILFNEMLPLILGPKTIEHFQLKITNGYTYTYNEAVDATILNEFSTAAYRLHSLVHGVLNLNTPDNKIVTQISLRDVFANPSLMYQPGAYDLRIAGLTGQGMKNFDNFFTREVTNHLFQASDKRFGLDLVALNIQRGRDHGLRSYNEYREICGLPKIYSFEELRSVLSNPAVADVLGNLYKSIDDVDLFIAGTSEKILPGAIVGPTFACIIGEQFRRIRNGDRFWYENGGMNTSFTPDQLAEIKKISLARILCDNSDVGIMQKYAMLLPSFTNPKYNCDQLPSINLRVW